MLKTSFAPSAARLTTGQLPSLPWSRRLSDLFDFPDYRTHLVDASTPSFQMR